MTFDEWKGAQRFNGIYWGDLKAAWDAATKAEREACRDACHEAIKRAVAEAGVKHPTFVGMCLEVGLERFDDALAANPR